MDFSKKKEFFFFLALSLDLEDFSKRCVVSERTNRIKVRLGWGGACGKKEGGESFFLGGGGELSPKFIYSGWRGGKKPNLLSRARGRIKSIFFKLPSPGHAENKFFGGCVFFFGGGVFWGGRGAGLGFT